jgi:SAM-dependent methyltransferase
MFCAARPSIHWKSKALLQRWLSRSPLGFHANYLLQRYVQRSLPLDSAEMRKMALLEAAHLQALLSYSQKQPREAVLLEIGAGADLALPILLYASGIDHQITIDIRALARRYLVNAVIDTVHTLDLPLQRRPAARIGASEDLRGVLRHRFGIDYLAPCDARHTGLTANSIDFIHSTNTLEHIPPADLPLILKECRRLLAPAGVLSLNIDYRDHYSYADRRISPYNFLQYSDAAWSRFNSALQYQNRLRHSDYLDLAAACGFRILSDRPELPSQSDLELLREIEIDVRFRAYYSQTIAIQGAHLVMTPK